MLLPKTLAQDIPYEYRLAVDQTRSCIVGAVAFADSGRLLYELRLHTIFNRRTEGIGTRLLDYVVAEATCRGRTEVKANVNALEEKTIHTFLRKRGFGMQSRCWAAAGDSVEIYRHLRDRCARIASNDASTREGWRIVPLSPDMFNEAGRVFAEHLYNVAPGANGSLSLAAYLGRYELSQALVVNGSLHGIVLITNQQNAAVWRLRVVTPQFRNTRTSAALLMRAAQVSVESGAQRLLFSYFDEAPDTVAFVRRMGMTTMQTADVLARTVAVKTSQQDHLSRDPQLLQQVVKSHHRQ